MKIATPLASVREREHSNCVVCSRDNSIGLGIEYVAVADGAVEAVFDCAGQYEGFRKTVHGGVISSLIDGAMTNCVFAKGYVAFTAELNVKFRSPVETGVPATVRAWVESSYRPLHVLKAEFVQNGIVKVTAMGKFMEREDD